MTDSEKLDLLIENVTEIKNDVSELKADMVQVKADIIELQSKTSRIEQMEQNITSIKLMLENEIRTNIQRVAEGHLDLSRNIHDAMRPSNEAEMLSIRVSCLETDVRMLKEKIS